MPQARMLLGLFFWLNITVAEANPQPDSLLALSSSLQWQRLGHYQEHGLSKGMTSEVDDTRFFLSPEGKYDPQAELQATVKHLQTTLSNNDVSIACRFPARTFWLHQERPDLIQTFPIDQCDELQRWQAQIPADSMSLIFPAAYINSPSSMFGHTLLRIDPASDSDANALLSWALNYGANADGGDGGILYAYKGLTGGYYGTYSLVPYFEKVKEYNDIDNRDIFEYRLNLTHEEILFLLLHAWELKGMQFQYFYFDENCAYQLLTLLEVARPQLRLTQQFKYNAIPADTVRSIEQAGLIADTTLRPSAKTEFNGYDKALSTQEKKWVRQLVFSHSMALSNIASLPEQQQLKLLKQAYRYSRLLAVEEDKNEQVKEASYQILRKISALPTQKEPPPPITVVRTEHGHRSQRWGLAGFHSSAAPKLNGALLNFRPTYHDWLDPLEGYAAGANIEMFDTQIYVDENNIMLHKLSVAQVQALRKVDGFFNPTSWYAGGGFERKPLRDNKLDGYIHTGRGKATGINQHLWYGFVSARYEPHNGLMPGARLGWLYQGALAFQLEASTLYSFVRDQPEHTLQSQISYHLGRQWSLRLDYRWLSNATFNEETISAGFFHYF